MRHRRPLPQRKSVSSILFRTLQTLGPWRLGERELSRGSEAGIRNRESGIRKRTGPGVKQDSGFRIRDSGFGIRDSVSKITGECYKFGPLSSGSHQSKERRQRIVAPFEKGGRATRGGIFLPQCKSPFTPDWVYRGSAPLFQRGKLLRSTTCLTPHASPQTDRMPAMPCAPCSQATARSLRRMPPIA